MIVIVGFMGAGKSTVGKKLANRLKTKFVDADTVIEQQHGPIWKIFAEAGESKFREIEAETIGQLLAQYRDSGVLALGGGACESPAVRQAITSPPHCVVFLDIPFQMALSRVGRDPNRPVLKDPALRQRFHDRQLNYRAVADITIEVGKQPATKQLNELVTLLDRFRDSL